MENIIIVKNEEEFKLERDIQNLKSSLGGFSKDIIRLYVIKDMSIADAEKAFYDDKITCAEFNYVQDNLILNKKDNNNLHNKFIEDFVSQSNLKMIGNLYYDNFCTASITDKNGDKMTIFNVFEDVILYFNDDKIGRYKLATIHGCKHWILV